MIVLSYRKLHIEGVYDFTLQHEDGRIEEYTYQASDRSPTTAFLTQWLKDNPNVEPEPWVNPRLQPNYYSFSPLAFRLMIARYAKNGTKGVGAKIAAMPDSPEQDELHTFWEYALEYEWDDSRTQTILGIAFPDGNAEEIWLKAAKEK